MSSSATLSERKPRQAVRIGSVSYLNAKPLIHGLDEADDLLLTLDVPSRLLDGLRQRLFDVALLPVIDYQRHPNLRILTAGGIGSDGPTLTVRIFSKVPVERIATLAVDADSHTSVALANIILAESLNLHPKFTDLQTDAEARLLIGDKVVCDEPAGFAHQIDLGQAWKDLTGLPFVFAAWTAHKGADLGDLPQSLESAKRLGLQNGEQSVDRHAIPRGWPAALARQYLTQNLIYDIGPRQLDAIQKFHNLAAKHGIIASPPRELET